MKISFAVLLLVSAIGGTAIFLYDVEPPPANSDWSSYCEPDTDDFPAMNTTELNIKEPDKTPVLPDPKPQLTDQEIKTRLGEVEFSMAYIRSRIEYKFQTSGRKLAAHWTLAQLVRRKTRLDSEHFEWCDYSVEYAEPNTASIICSSEKGLALPTGPLVMTLTIDSGRSQYSGCIFPMDNAGNIVLSLNLKEQLVSRVEEQITVYYQNWIRGDSYSSRNYRRWQRSHFHSGFNWDTDQVTSLEGNILSITIESIQGNKLSHSYSGSFDLEKKNWKSTGSISLFAALPEKQEVLEEWLIEYVDSIHYKITNNGNIDIAKAEDLACSNWYYSPATLIPGDVKITYDIGKVTGTVLSTWGRPLPFTMPSYTYTDDDDPTEE